MGAGLILELRCNFLAACLVEELQCVVFLGLLDRCWCLGSVLLL